MNASTQDTVPAAEARWSADPRCRTVDWGHGKILIEGTVFRIEDRDGPHALDHLAALIEREGPSAMAKAEGDFVAIVVTEQDIYAFKSFTSQYQLYYRERDGAVANRLGFFFDPSSTG